MEDRETPASDDQAVRDAQRAAERRVETEETHAEDVVSDPARSDDVGADWSDEGGATPTGPATQASEDTRDEKRRESELPPDDLPAITLDPPD